MRTPALPVKNGFSLIQMALIVTVLGIVLASMIPGGRFGAQSEKEAITLERMKAIAQAMEGYMATHLRLPCPANASYDRTSEFYAVGASLADIRQPCFNGDPEASMIDSTSITASRTSGNKTATVSANIAAARAGALVSGTGIPNGTHITSIDRDAGTILLDQAPTTTTNGALTLHTVVGGSVPTKTLNLPDDYGLDGYGRRITYIVDQRAVTASAPGSSFTTSRPTDAPASCYDMQSQGLKGNIEIFDTAGGAVKDNVMWALISYGKSGHGAFPAEGSDVTTRIDASGGSTTAIPDATQINAFIATGTSFTQNFSYQLVKKDPDPASPYNTFVWYAEKTKNTCCLGKACSLGFNINLGSSGTADNTTGNTIAHGDINGDGIQDMVIGNYQYTTVGVVDQRVWVIFGSKTGWPVNVPYAISNISSGDGSYGFVISNGVTANTNFARSVTAGDVNHDGYDDVVIGGRYITVVFGHATSTYLTHNTINTGALSRTITDYNAGLTIVYGNFGLGQQVVVADIQGSGYKSIIFSGGLTSNSAWVVYDSSTLILNGSGNAQNSWSAGNNTTAAQGFKIVGSGGYSIGRGFFSMSAADVNADGRDDILLGDNTANAVYVLLSGAYTINAKNTMDAACTSAAVSTNPACIGITSGTWFDGTNGVTISSPGGDTGFGGLVSSTDMNTDGIKDIVTSSTSATNNIYIFNGRSTANWSATGGSDNTADVTINVHTNRPAWITAYLPDFINVGDVNNDGLKDLLLGSYNSSAPAGCSKGVNTGSIYALIQPQTGWPASGSLFTGTANDACDANELNTTTFPGSFRIDGPDDDTFSYMADVFDFNHDGRNDIVVAAPGYSADDGGIFAVHGRRKVPWDSVFDLDDIDY